MRFGDTFRSGIDETGQNQNLLDQQMLSTFGAYSGVSMWTAGGAIVDSVTLPTRGIASTWRVYSVSFSGSLIMLVPNEATAAGPVQLYGKLAPLRCGISLQGPQTNQQYSGGAGSAPYVPLAQSPLPRDSSLIASFWDPESDPLPPMYYETGAPLSPTQMLDIVGGVTPPQPLDVPAGGNLYVGAWLEPALMACQVVGGFGILSQYLGLYNVQYEIYYDELSGAQGPVNPQ